MSDVEVRDNPAESRVEGRVDGELAGFAAYNDRDGARVFTHTEVDPAYAGQGVGGAIARGALDGARASGLSVVPRCPFIKGWIERHPDYADLVATS
jgi:predicted GNAT family acetyltransferase